MIENLKQLQKEAYERYVAGINQLNVLPEIIFPVVDKPVVSIVLAVYNQYEYTLRCLNSIFQNVKDVPYEIIIVDDCSQDETREIDKHIKNIKILRHQENLGYIQACNHGADLATGKYLYLLNNDTQLVGDAISPMLQVLEKKNVGIVGSKLIYSDGTLQNAGCRLVNGEVIQVGEGDLPLLPMYNDEDDTVDFLCGASIMLPLLIWEEVAGYDTRFGFGYSEDVDLCLKVKNIGYELAYVPTSEVVHFKSKTFGTKNLSLIKENKEKLQQKWADLSLMSKVRVVWGAGKMLQDYYNVKWEVSFVVDNNPDLWGTKKQGLNICSPDVLYNLSGVRIIICSGYYREIATQIKEMQLRNVEIWFPDMMNDVVKSGRMYQAFSLFSEDSMLDSYIKFYGKKKIRHYIDVGTNHPVHGNATIKFYLQGASGCLVEPNPQYEILLQMVRPRDKVMICGCSSNENEGKNLCYYQIEGIDTRNTFSDTVAKEYMDKGFEVTKKSIPVRSINNIIEEYSKPIDYISIDVEGLEYDILKDFMFDKYRVQYFNVEKSDGPIVELFTKHGYKLFAETPSNWLFERDD